MAHASRLWRNNTGTMAKPKFYAVVKGRKPGIYTEWFGSHGAEVQIKGFANAVYKSFPTRDEAKAWSDSANHGASSQHRQMSFLPVDEEKAPAKKPRLTKKSIQEKPATRAHADGSRAVIYTDGGCSKNPGPGGYGAVLLVDGQRRELSGGFAHTTNNRMELMGCIKALEALDTTQPVTVHSDSQYVVNGITKGWAKRWKKNDWMRNKDEAAENSDLWEMLLDLCEKRDVEFQWVRGHDGNEGNERCDTLAVEMTQRRDLPPDHGYKKK